MPSRSTLTPISPVLLSRPWSERELLERRAFQVFGESSRQSEAGRASEQDGRAGTTRRLGRLRCRTVSRHTGARARDDEQA
jgi:hypothetical protein